MQETIEVMAQPTRDDRSNGMQVIGRLPNTNKNLRRKEEPQDYKQARQGMNDRHKGALNQGGRAKSEEKTS